MAELIGLNIGGKIFCSTRSTLCSEDNFFTVLLSNRIPTTKDAAGNYFIDRDGQYFKPILEFLRTGELVIPSHLSSTSVYREADYYQIKLPDSPENQLSAVSISNQLAFLKFISSYKQTIQSFPELGLFLKPEMTIHCPIENCEIRYKNLRSIKFNSRLAGVSFIGCNLEGAHFNGLNGCKFLQCELVGCQDDKHITDVCYHNCDFRDCNLSSANIPDVKNCRLYNTTLTSAKLGRIVSSTFHNIDFSPASFNPEMYSNTFEHVNFSGEPKITCQLYGTTIVQHITKKEKNNKFDQCTFSTHYKKELK